MYLNWLLFSFKGRICRKTYWQFTLAMVLIILVPAIAVLGVGTTAADNYVTFMSLATLYPSLAVQAKRWHDRDKSAWWILINFVPFIGGIWALIENGFLIGTNGKNRFGEDPVSSTPSGNIEL